MISIKDAASEACMAANAGGHVLTPYLRRFRPDGGLERDLRYLNAAASLVGRHGPGPELVSHSTLANA